LIPAAQAETSLEEAFKGVLESVAGKDGPWKTEDDE